MPLNIQQVTSGSGVPGQQLNQNGTSADRREAAKAAFVGEGKLTPSDTPVDPQVETIERNKRKIKMKTNHTLHRFPQETAPIESSITASTVEGNPTTTNASAVGASDQSRISDTNETADEETKPLSPQFAALARQKRALQVKESELRQKEELLTAREAGNNPELLTRLKSDTLGVLQESGALTPEFFTKLTEHLMANPSSQPSPHALAQELEKKLTEQFEEKLNKRFQDQEAAAEESALTEMLYEAEGVAKANPETYEFLVAENAYESVLRHIHKNYKQTGRVLDVREAMDTVEKQLSDRYERIAKLKKFNSFLPTAEPAAPQSAEPKQMKTLTARDGARPLMSARERAIAAFWSQK